MEKNIAITHKIIVSLSSFFIFFALFYLARNEYAEIFQYVNPVNISHHFQYFLPIPFFFAHRIIILSNFHNALHLPNIDIIYLKTLEFSREERKFAEKRPSRPKLDCPFLRGRFSFYQTEREEMHGNGRFMALFVQ